MNYFRCSILLKCFFRDVKQHVDWKYLTIYLLIKNGHLTSGENLEQFQYKINTKTNSSNSREKYKTTKEILHTAVIFSLLERVLQKHQKQYIVNLSNWSSSTQNNPVMLWIGMQNIID